MGKTRRRNMVGPHIEQVRAIDLTWSKNLNLAEESAGGSIKTRLPWMRQPAIRKLEPSHRTGVHSETLARVQSLAPARGAHASRRLPEPAPNGLAIGHNYHTHRNPASPLQ